MPKDVLQAAQRVQCAGEGRHSPSGRLESRELPGEMKYGAQLMPRDVLLRAAGQIDCWRRRTRESFTKLAENLASAECCQSQNTIRPVLGQLVKALEDEKYLKKVRSRMSQRNLDWLLTRIEEVCGPDTADYRTVTPRPIDFDPAAPDWQQKKEWHANALADPKILHGVLHTLKYKVGCFCHDSLVAHDRCRWAMCHNTLALFTDLTPALTKKDVTVLKLDWRRQVERIQALFKAALGSIPLANPAADSDAEAMTRSYAGFSLYRLGAVAECEGLRSEGMELQFAASSVPSDPSAKIMHNLFDTFEYQLVNLPEEARGYGPHIRGAARDAVS